MKLRKICWALGSLALITALSATAFAADVIEVAPVPEMDPGTLIAIGVLGVGFLTGVSRYRRK